MRIDTIPIIPIIVPMSLSPGMTNKKIIANRIATNPDIANAVLVVPSNKKRSYNL